LAEATAVDLAPEAAGLGPHRHAELRRPGRPDRGHAPHPGRGEALDRRERFLHALNFCMLLPGPEAQQLCIYIGWLLHRTLGGIIAGVLFVLPGLVAIMVLSWLYALYGNVGFVEALFFGLKAAVLAIVLQAVVRIGARALRNRAMVALAAPPSSPSSCSTWPFPSSSPRRR
jgi:chromate transport protein ChrA